jgi:hypothetical protein
LWEKTLRTSQAKKKISLTYNHTIENRDPEALAGFEEQRDTHKPSGSHGKNGKFALT